MTSAEPRQPLGCPTYPATFREIEPGPWRPGYAQRDIEWVTYPPRTPEYAVFHEWSDTHWWAQIDKIFDVAVEGANPYPSAASMRAAKSGHGRICVVPIEWFEESEIPDDLSSPEIEAASYKTPFNVSLPLSGAPLLERPAAASLERARAAGQRFVVCRPVYVP